MIGPLEKEALRRTGPPTFYDVPTPMGARDNIIAWYVANCGVLSDAGNFRMGSSSAGVRDESIHYFNINVVTPLQSPGNAILLFVTGF